MRKITLSICIVITLILIVFSTAVLLKSEADLSQEAKETDAESITEEILQEEPKEILFIEDIPGATSSEVNFAGKTYKMYCQYERNYAGYNDYLAAHGCTVTTLTAVLRAYAPECSEWSPYETITIAESRIAGEELFKKNYSKKPDKKMPFTFLGATQILDLYGIANEYEPYFDSDEEAKKDMLDHLCQGKPIIFVISQVNRETNKKTKKWTLSYHTMLMIGTDGKENVLIGNPAGSQRFQLVSIDEMIDYMWSCTEKPNSFYWNGKAKCGGYIKIME